MRGHDLAGVLDFQIIAATKTGAVNHGLKLEDYFTKVLKIDYRNYINAGVLLMNTSELRNEHFLGRSLNLISTIPMLYPDQDVFNSCCHSIRTLSPKFNYQNIFDNRKFLEIVGDYTFENYFSDFTIPMIIHYASKQKINDLISPYEIIFWEYARQTPYYERLLEMRIMDMRYKKK